MKELFEKQILRKSTMSRKWDGLQENFGASEDIIPLWVADMDFAVPKEVQAAFAERVDHGVFGYVYPDQASRQAIVNWLQTRHQWQIKPEMISFTPGLLSGITMTLDTFTAPGDGIVIQSPVYPPFFAMVQTQGRKLLENPLIEGGEGLYQMDLDGLEEIFKNEQPQWMILCNPHNPVGRVWRKEELTDLAKLCAQYGVKVLSDEIHADLTLGDHKYTPFASIAEPLGVTVFTGYAASKSFNIAGLTTAFWIISDEAERKKFWSSFAKYKFNEPNLFGVIATQVCYEKCDYWLDGLREYLLRNAYYVNEMLNYHAPGIKANFPEGTYLGWLDCRELGLSQPELKKFFIEKAKVALNDGMSFGSAGEGFMRLNFGCSRALLREGLERIVEAARTQRGWKS